MNSHETSSWYHASPWRAAGRERVVVVVPPLAERETPTTTLFRLSSLLWNGRVPQTWQTEFTLNVVWCNRPWRTSPPPQEAGEGAVPRPGGQPADGGRDGPPDQRTHIQ